jgi:putative transposon-encoded protein
MDFSREVEAFMKEHVKDLGDQAKPSLPLA